MIKFNKHNITNGQIKARVSYDLDNHISGKPNVTIRAKDYDNRLGQIFGSEFQNDTDLQTDYFEKGRVRLFENHPLYTVARNVAEAKIAADAARYA